MENVNFLLLCQLTANVLSFILSLCLFVPVCFHLSNFKGHCLLFSSGKWNSSGHLMVSWSSEAYCDYVVCAGIILMLVSAVKMYKLSAFLFRGVDSSFLSAFIDIIVNVILTAMTFVGAIFITLGFKAWCDAITTRYISCRDASSNDLAEKGVVISGFYIQIGTAQFAAWGAWVCSVALTMFSILKMCKYHQQANIAISMAKERQRLLGETADKPPIF